MDDLTLVIPAKKEKESLPAVLDELKDYTKNISIILEENDTETIDSFLILIVKLSIKKIKVMVMH